MEMLKPYLVILNLQANQILHVKTNISKNCDILPKSMSNIHTQLSQQLNPFENFDNVPTFVPILLQFSYRENLNRINPGQ